MPRTAKSTVGNTNYVINGVSVTPSVPNVGDKLSIRYDGLLSKSGAAHIYAHIGYGMRWDNLQDIPMMKTGMGFETTIPVVKSDTINVCFKDCANHWDNNSGSNYSFDVAQ